MNNSANILDFVRAHKAEVEAIIHGLFSKIEKDVATILLNKWASEVSQSGFYHVHIMVPNTLRPVNLATIEASINLLYHDEVDFEDNPNRNIFCHHKSKPNPIKTSKYKITIKPNDLDQVELVTVYFSKKLTGLKFKIVGLN